MVVRDDGGGVEELHGIFQFTDGLFEETVKAKEYILPEYIPLNVYPKWFLSSVSTSSDDSFTVEKHRMEYLFYCQRYQEAFKVAQELLQLSKPRREIIDAALICATKVGADNLANEYRQIILQMSEDTAPS